MLKEYKIKNMFFLFDGWFIFVRNTIYCNDVRCKKEEDRL